MVRVSQERERKAIGNNMMKGSVSINTEMTELKQNISTRLAFILKLGGLVLLLIITRIK